MPTLHWLNKKHDIKAADRVPYRLLQSVDELSYGAPDTENMLIQGDNLDALKALLPYFSGKVKCIYIDPPYNTGAAFEHYDDNLENSIWLGNIWPRLELLRDLLAEDGSMWVSIDDRQGHYLKVILDEVFGRSRFVANVVWQKRTSRENRKAIGSAHDHILVYATAGGQEWKKYRNLLPDTEKGYANPDGDLKGPWRSIPFSAQGFRTNQMYKIETPTGDIHDPPKGRCWGATEPEFVRLRDTERRVYFPKNGRGRPRIKKYQFEESGLAPMTWWTAAECGDNQQAKKEILELFNDEDAFDTPKPERLLERILHIATNPGDLVLDSFLGSGTTMAVAIKMGRRAIGVEMGEHAATYCVPRIKKVIEGEQGGTSGSAGWRGGGGFRFYRLGESIFDLDGRINSKVRFSQLAAHVWFSETRTALRGRPQGPRLGVHRQIAYYLLYNGILGDKQPDGGNVLTGKVLAALPVHDGPKVIYGECCQLSAARLKAEKIAFRQTPYDLKSG